MGYFQSNGPANGMSGYKDKDGEKFVITAEGRLYYKGKINLKA